MLDGSPLHSRSGQSSTRPCTLILAHSTAVRRIIRLGGYWEALDDGGVVLEVVDNAFDTLCTITRCLVMTADVWRHSSVQAVRYVYTLL